PSPPKPEDTRTTVIGMDLTAPVPRQAPIPATAVEILRELAAQSDELNKRITGGAPLGEMWVPALRTKDLGLALVADHLKEIPASQQALARNAADRLVRSAFAIDNFGDLGDRDKIVAAHDVFKSAVKDLKSAYASIR
ncbi:MAG TPA: hypothetical protein VFY29_01155, partial [Terriglobia bacterium]|nr:hypothetical protein [Terriglobia bacterium]